MSVNFTHFFDEAIDAWTDKELNLVYLIDKSTSSISVSDLEMHYHLNYKFYMFLKGRVKNQWFFLDDSETSPMLGLVYTSSRPIEDDIVAELKDYVKKYVEPVHNN